MSNRVKSAGRAGMLSLMAALCVAGVTSELEAQGREVFAWGGDGFLLTDRPMLGISVDLSLDRELDDLGVLISGVTEGGPADEAGLEVGDVVVSLDGHSLTEPLDDRQERRFEEDQSFPGQRLLFLARDLEEDESVEVEVERDGDRISLTVSPKALDTWRLGGDLGANWGRFPRAFRSSPEGLRFELRDMDGQTGNLLRLRGRAGLGGRAGESMRTLTESGFPNLYFGGPSGLELAELNPGLGQYFGTEVGVLVLDVGEESALGLEAGDVVVDIDGRSVRNRSHLLRILASYDEEEPVVFGVVRDGREISVEGSLIR